MEDDLLQDQPAFKLYNDRSVYIGTFIGGPLVAGYFAAENFKQLGQIELVKKTWIISIISTIIIFGGILCIPDDVKMPNYIIPLLYTLLAQFLIKKYQGASITAHTTSGGQTYSAWRAVWIGLVGLMIMMAIIFVLILLTNKDLLQ